MRLTITVLGLHLFTVEATTDETGDDDSLKPPMGFAGGSGLHTEVHEPMLDTVDRR